MANRGSMARSPPSFDGPRLRAIPAGPEHAAQIQACFDGTPDYFERTEGRPATSSAAVDLLAEAEADPARRIYALVPCGGGAAVGVLDMYLDHPVPDTAHVGLLLFRQSCQGLGYGKETTAAVEAGLARVGYRALRLSVTDENEDARAFWERLGYAEVDRLERGVTVFEKPLRSA